jgi:Mrp family chromosome partitioning ATPase
MATAADFPELRDLDELTEREVILEQGGATYASIPAVPVSGFVPEPASAQELQLVQKLFFLGSNTPRVAVFCGVEQTDGAELVCARTAEVLAGLVSEPVCLMDANLARPTFHVRYDVGAPFGQTRFVQEMDEDNRRSPLTNLWVLPASALKECRAAFAPDRVRDRLAGLRKRFRFLLVCAPAFDAGTEGLLLGQMADGVVLTLLAQSTPREAAMRARSSLDTYNIRLLGSVLNVLPPEAPRRKFRPRSTFLEYWESKAMKHMKKMIRMG